jgi:hypothetical protein
VDLFFVALYLEMASANQLDIEVKIRIFLAPSFVVYGGYIYLLLFFLFYFLHSPTSLD